MNANELGKFLEVLTFFLHNRSAILFVLTLVMASGATLRLGMIGDMAVLLAIFTGVLFIPSLALVWGV